MIVGFDLDDVLLDFKPALHAYHNEHYGTSDSMEHFIEDLAKMWGCSEGESVRRVFEFYQSPQHWNTPPVEGAVEAIRNLKRHIHIFKRQTIGLSGAWGLGRAVGDFA